MSRLVNFVRTHYLPESTFYPMVAKQKSYQFLKFLGENPENMEILGKNYIMTEIVKKLYSPGRMGYHPEELNYIDIKNEEGKYIQVECPFIANIAKHFKETGLEIPLEFYKAVLNTGIYVLILPGTTPQQIYEFLIAEPDLGLENPTSKNLILLVWKQFRHLLEPKIDWIDEIFLEEKKEALMDDPVLNEIILDYGNGVDDQLSKYIIKDLRDIIIGYTI